MQNNNAGSIWRKWDLHVHTPESVLENNFGNNFEDYAVKLFKKAFENKISVIGITDYFSIAGYKKLIKLKSNKKWLSSSFNDQEIKHLENIKLFPNIEFRLNQLVEGNKINFHVIFSDTVDVEDIEQNFLHIIRFTHQSAPQAIDEAKPLTTRNLERLGQTLKDQHPKFKEHSDLFVGMMNAGVSHEELVSILSADKTSFNNQYIIGVPSDEDLSKIDWNSQGHLIRKVILQKSDFLFASNPNTIQWARGEKSRTQEEFIIEFKSLKPCYSCSDAHDFERLFICSKNRFTWVKADPTFEGLLQSIKEPAERVFIGHTPPLVKRITERPDLFIKNIEIKKETTADKKNEWFNTEIELNPGLISIIGNKGSGKSALADIIALLGNTDKYKSFSFLNKEKFRHRKNGKAHLFHSSLKWANGKDTGPIALSSNPPNNLDPEVHYIPQSYLEDICNDLECGTESKFYNEIQTVIFSHIKEEEREDHNSLQSILTNKIEINKERINNVISDLSKTNKAIIDFKTESSGENIERIKSKIHSLKEDLKSHAENKPKTISKPDEDSSQKKEIEQSQKRIELITQKLKKAHEKHSKTTNKIKVINKRRSKAEEIKETLINIKDYVHSKIENIKELSTDINLNVEELISFETKTELIDEYITHQNKIKLRLANHQSNSNDDKSQINTIEQLKKQLSKEKDKLSAPQLKYQKYKEDLEKWERRRNTIIGSSKKIDSIRYCYSKLNEIKDLPLRIKELEQQRLDFVKKIYELKQSLQKEFSKYYTPVQSFIDSHKLAQNDKIELEFNVDMKINNFSDRFLEHINQGRSGSFYGSTDGRNRVENIIEETDFNTLDETIEFTKKILLNLTHNMKGEEPRPASISDQLKSGISELDIYNYLFSLSYLSPEYNLMWSGKDIEQLSPGERGNLLLVFYLLIDQRESPLIIDQPEENLDNQTIFQTLVPCLRDAKERRQIIMVTHNPNLAVVCDSDQIIHSSMDKDNFNRIQYETGSIENAQMNSHLVNILEGTKPAFQKRDSKYQ